MLNDKLRCLCAIGCVLFMVGCALQSPSRPSIETYRMDYASPEMTLSPSLPYKLSLVPFRIAPTFDTSHIIYRQDRFHYRSYHYHRWAAHPAHMIGHDLARDFRQTGLFEAVLFPGSKALPEVMLEGMVEALYEDNQGKMRQAVVSLGITLLKRNQRNIQREVLLQKQFTNRQDCRDDTPDALVEAMGLAMQHVSRDIITTVYDRLSQI